MSFTRLRPYALATAAIALALISAAAYRNFRKTAPTPDSATAAPQIPMWFERNTGEFPSQVAFASRSIHQTVFLTNTAMVIAAPGAAPVSIEWRNGQPARRMAGENPIHARIDHFGGANHSRWKTGDSNGRFSKVRYEQVYKGIDLVFHPQGNQLEHDFVVAPGVDPAQIVLGVNGATSLKLDTDGSLAILNGKAEIRQSKPVAFQNIDGKRIEIAANYKISGNEIQFELGSYDTTQVLVIDPVLKYASYLGGTLRTTPATVVAEPGTGILWIAGTTTSTDFPAVGESIRGVETMGNGDIYIAKVDPSKPGPEALLYAAFVGGTGSDEARSMVLDGDGNAVIAGTTTSGDFPVVGSYDSTIEGGRDAIVLKIDPRRAGTAALVYTSFLGGDGEDFANAIATDSAGRFIVAGYTVSNNFPLTTNAIQRFPQGGYETFIARINPDGGTNGLEYSTYYGGSATDIANAVAVDAAGLIYVAGATSSANFPTSDNPYRLTYQNAGDMFLIRVDTAKSGVAGIDYGTYLGGTGIDSAQAMHLDALGNVTLAGYTTSNDMPIAGNAPQTRNAGNADAYVARLNIATNTLSFATYLGGSASDLAYGLTVDGQGRIHIVGYTYSNNLNVTRNALQSKLGGGYDAFVASMNPSLPAAESLLYSSYWGAGGNENGLSVTADGSCNVTLVASTTTKKLAVTNNAFQGEGTGFPDTFLSSVNICQ